MPAPAMMMSTSLEAPPISLVFPRRESDSAGSFIEVPWDRSEGRRGSLTRELRKVKLPRRNRPSTATVMSNGSSSSSYGGSSRGGSGTDASLFGIDAAKRQAVASLSMEPGSPSSSRRSSLDDNAFAQFARFEERRASEAKTAKSTTPKFRMPFSKWSRSHKETPMSPSLSSDIAPDEPSYRSGGLAIDLGPRDAGASPRLDTKLRARSIEEAVESLGWYWNSKADAIWGPAQKEHSAHKEPPFMGRCMSVVDLTTSAKSLLPPSVQRLAGKAHRSKSDAAESFKSWDDYLEAYAAGSFDISEASRQPRVEGHRPVDGHLAAPMPDWELSRKLAICRAGVFDLPPSLLRKIDDIAMRIKEALDMDITYVDVLLGDEGYLILGDQVKHYLSCRRDTMCAHTILNSQRGFTVLDRHRDWRFKDNPLLSHISFYSGSPIRSGTGLPFGALCVMDSRPRRDFSQEDKDMIRNGAQAVSRILEDNFANRFEAKMNLMSQAFEAVKGSLRHCTLDTTAWKGPMPELKLVESALSQTRQCMQLDAAYIVALKDDVAQVVASAGGPVPRQASAQAGLHSEVQTQEAGYVIYQNELLDRPGHSELVALAPSGGPQYSCGIMISLPSLPSQSAGSASSSHDSQASPATTMVSLPSSSVDFVLVVASTQPRHVLGVEDLRFLQSVKPYLAAALRQVPVPPFPVVDVLAPLSEATAKVQLSNKETQDSGAAAKPGRRGSGAALRPSSASKRWSPPEGGSPAKPASPRPRSRSEHQPHPFSASSESQPQFSYAVDPLPPVPPLTSSTITRSPHTGDYYFNIGASRPSTAISQPPPRTPMARRPASSKGERPPPSPDSRPSSSRGLGRQMVNGVMKGSLSSLGGSDVGRRSNKAAPTAVPSTSSVEFLALPPQSFMTAATKTEDGPSSNPGSSPASPKYRFCQDCAGILPLLSAGTPPRHDASGRSQRPSFSSSPSSPTFSSSMQLPLSTSPRPPQSQPLQASKSTAGATPTTPSKTLHPGNIVCTCPSSNGAGTWTPKNPALSIPPAVHEGQRLDEWTAPQHHQTPQAASLDLPSTSPHGASASLASSFGFSLPGGSTTSLLLPGSLSGSVDSSVSGGLAPVPRASRRLSSGGGLAPMPPKARVARATRRPQTASEATTTTSASRENGVPLSPRARQQSATDAF